MSTEVIDNSPQQPDDTQALAPLMEQVLQAVAGIRYGSVELVIHGGRVVQIERRERVRLQRQDTVEISG